MTFIEPVFVPFFLFTYVGFLLLRNNRATQLIFLNLLSCVFYGWSSPKFLLLLLATSTLDFFLAHRIYKASKPVHKKLWLLLSVSSNLGVLAFFKYSAFFLENTNALMGHFGMASIQTFSVALPLGISFYSFEAISYTVDVYRGIQRPSTSYKEFLFFMCEFPKLVAGPIVRAGEFLPQLQSGLYEKIDCAGIFLVIYGVLKKILLGDTLGYYFVDPLFQNPARYDGLTLLLGAFCYALQIFFDFSGYSDIACGLARLMGLRLPLNFRAPYLAVSPSEFWERWHITLSKWLRDYLYIPLGGNRGSNIQTLRNLMIVMFMGGLWHGANWTFAVWGLLHGVYLVIYRAIDYEDSFFRRIPHVGRRILLFILVSLALVVFRSKSLPDVGIYFHSMGVNGWLPAESTLPMISMLVIAWLVHDFVETRLPQIEETFMRFPIWVHGGVVYGLFVLMTYLNMTSVVRQAFIYFQF